MPLRDMLHPSQLSLRVKCPNCPSDMTVKTAFPAVSAEDLLEITYACPTCKGETKRWVKS